VLTRLGDALARPGSSAQVPLRSFEVLLKAMRPPLVWTGNAGPEQPASAGPGAGGAGGGAGAPIGAAAAAPAGVSARDKAALAALGLLRLLVLQPACWAYMAGDSRQRCLAQLLADVEAHRLAAPEEPAAASDAGGGAGGGAGTCGAGSASSLEALRLAVVGNLFALPSGTAFATAPANLHRLLPALARDLRGDHTLGPTFDPTKAVSLRTGPAVAGEAEVRQAAAMALHNLAFELPLAAGAAPAGAGNAAPAPAVRLLRDLLAGLGAEADILVAERRCRAASGLLRRLGAGGAPASPGHAAAAAALVQALPAGREAAVAGVEKLVQRCEAARDLAALLRKLR